MNYSKNIERLLKNQEITEEHVSCIYNLDGPCCLKNKHRFITFSNTKEPHCRENPNCFERLRTKYSKFDSFGRNNSSKYGNLDDKEIDLLRGEDQYCGLKNLGATCYMNSLLQCLYFTPSFRDAVYNWTSEEENKNDHILQELKIVFAYLQIGSTKNFVPTELANKLELKTSVQQDVQEFYQLLIFQYLDQCFKRSNNEKLKTIIDELFVLKGDYKTTCRKCNNSSNIKAEWNLLSLSIEDSTNLQEALRGYIRDEHIDGYNCEHCKEHTQVTRSTKILSLPPILNIQFLRFVYDKTSGIKKKLNKYISFEDELDMGNYIDGISTCSYKLYGVICHIGTNACAGHYIAFIRDSSNCWWKFDDTNVSKYSSYDPFYYNKEQTPYILLFKKKNFPDPPLKIPENVEKEVYKYNSDAMEEAHQQQQTKLREKENKDTLRKTYKDIKKMIHVNSDSKEYYWINNSWIKKWFNQDTDLGPIDNSELKCEHDAVQPDVTKMKRISKEAWESLHKIYGGEPILTGDNNCYLCVTKKFEELRQNKLDSDEKMEMINLYHYPRQTKDLYYVSRPWFDDWRVKKLEETKNLPKNFTYGIACEHGNLVADYSKFVSIPEKIFFYLKKNFPCEDILELPLLTEVCPVCKEKKDIEITRIEEEKRIREREKSNLYSFYYSSRRNYFSSNSSYYLIDITWFNQWCAYIDNYWDPKPGAIDNSSFICPHQRLNCDIIEEISRDISKAPFILVEDCYYKKIVESYGEAKPEISLLVIRFTHYDGITNATINPEVCNECASSLKQKRMEEAKNFKDKFIQINYYSKKENVLASCTTTVLELKLLIFEKYEIEPRYQKLTCDNVHLSNPNHPLSFYGVTYLKDIILHREYDGDCEPMDEVFEDIKEIGFAGTNLTEWPLEKRSEKQEEKQEEKKEVKNEENKEENKEEKKEVNKEVKNEVIKEEQKKQVNNEEKQDQKQQEQLSDTQEEKPPEKKPKTTPKEDPPLVIWPQCKHCTYINTIHLAERTCEMCEQVN